MIEDGHLDEDLKPMDRLGRQELHRMNVLSFMRAIPGFASRFQTTVPDSYWTGKRKGCEVKCPCGTETEFELGVMHECPGCERIYLHVGRQLRVGNSPTREVGATS